jgi:uncharacterized membrane protein
MDLARTWRHLLHSPLTMKQCFPDSALSRIESAVHTAEKEHSGEIRIALEGDLGLGALWADQSPRERAIEVFSQLGVWDTERNNGVLIYVLLADRDVEIVADRGFTPHVEPHEWEGVCRAMESELAAGRWEEGIVAGVDGVSRIIAKHFPRGDEDPNELPDRPGLV